MITKKANPMHALRQCGKTASATEFLKQEIKEGLCFKCQHRADSILRVLGWRVSGAKGMCTDPTPKVECKSHSGYGETDETRATCRDFLARRDFLLVSHPKGNT